MKKNLLLDGDNINLIVLFKIIWNDRIKILLITIISFLVGIGYNSQIPNSYLNSLVIKPSKIVDIAKIDNVKRLIKSNQSDQLNQFNQLKQLKQSTESGQSILSSLDRFINEVEDYKEFLLIIKNTKKVKMHFSKINIEDQEKALFKYVGLLKLVKPKKNETNYTLNFRWHDPVEARQILEDTLNLASKNLKRSIELELEQDLNFEKKLLLNKDSARLGYLKEQSSIAKELKITDNQIDNINLTQSSGVSLNINTADIAYYLRGYKAIDKEIELIQNREYQNLKTIKLEIDLLKKENINFANYDVNLINVKPLKDTKLILIISVLLGFIVGIFYALISNVFRPKNVNKIN